VNLGVTVASPYGLGFRKFYCAKVTQFLSDWFVLRHKTTTFSELGEFP
jgi:hypothetical protein